MSWITALSVLGLLLLSPFWVGAEICGDCHQTVPVGVHAELACQACHNGSVQQFAGPSASHNRAAGCVGCHQNYAGLFDQAMTSRAAEHNFVDRTYGEADPHFFEKNCQSCHVSDCLDCHGGDGHRIARPDQAA